MESNGAGPSPRTRVSFRGGGRFVPANSQASRRRAWVRVGGRADARVGAPVRGLKADHLAPFPWPRRSGLLEALCRLHCCRPREVALF